MVIGYFMKLLSLLFACTWIICVNHAGTDDFNEYLSDLPAAIRNCEHHINQRNHHTVEVQFIVPNAIYLANKQRLMSLFPHYVASVQIASEWESYRVICLTIKHPKKKQ
jgi:hypothetical protein